MPKKKPYKKPPLRNFNLKSRGPHYKDQDSSLPHAIISDLDGTLAILHDRSPYDCVACGSDKLNEPVADILKTYATIGITIILFSGREEKSREETIKWLKRHEVPFNLLEMRADGDLRKDNIVKKDMYENHVKGKYFIKFVLDDRNQVVDLWRLDLGLPCLQVNYGNF